MKSLVSSLLIISLFVGLNAFAHEDHDHEKVTGPNGGRLLFGVDPHLEFLVLEDRTVKISAFDHHNKAASIDGFTVKLTGGSRLSPTRLSFEKSGNALVSNGKLPDKESFPVVIQIKSANGGKSVLEKFQLNLEECPTCDYLEYACSCDHHHDHDHDHGHGHDHKHDKKKS